MKKIISVVVLLTLALLCCSGCAQNVPFYSAEIYHSSIASDEWVDSYSYIKSADELKSYYDANKDGLESMKEEVFDSDKYDQDFFEDKCLLLYFRRSTFVIHKSLTEIESISEVNGVLNIKMVYKSSLTDLATDSVHIVVELDKEYIDKEVKLIEEFSEE